MTPCAKYKAGYKLQLTERYVDSIPILPKKDIVTRFISLSTQGKLVVNAGYAWDGPSGIPIYSKALAAASLPHDALYQLFRLGFVDRDRYRKIADMVFQERYLERMNAEPIWWKRGPLWWRRLKATTAFEIVNNFAEFASREDRIRKVISVPEGCDEANHNPSDNVKWDAMAWMKMVKRIDKDGK